MPISILEAFAAGLPVVTVASGGIPYFVEHERTGLLSEVGDVSALACNVHRVIEDPQLAHRLVKNAREESVRYEWPAIRGAWLRLYWTLAAINVEPGNACDDAPPKDRADRAQVTERLRTRTRECAD
jgi:glycosyltransferase involved in cell wall biosynthesis